MAGKVHKETGVNKFVLTYTMKILIWQGLELWVDQGKLTATPEERGDLVPLLQCI